MIEEDDMKTVRVKCRCGRECSVERDPAAEAVLAEAAATGGGRLLAEIVCGACGAANKISLAAETSS
jgi:hypothetical protein